MSIQLPDGSIDRPGIFPQPMQDAMYRPEKYLTAEPNAVSGPSEYTLQQYAQPYAAQQYEQPYVSQYAPQQYAPPQMFFEPGAINDASVNAALAVLNRGPVNRYQSLTPDMYSNFYAPPLATNTAAYSGLGVPDYNDPNSKYLPPPPPPPPAAAAAVAQPRYVDSGSPGELGGYEAASGADIGAAVGGGIDMGVDGGLGGPSSAGSGASPGCVIATHAVANGNFTKREKQKAVVWCVKTLHSKWWGESIRRGYRFYGNRAINAGKAHEYYDEFRDFIRFATGTRRNTKTAKIFIWRSAQFFVTGLFVKGN